MISWNINILLMAHFIFLSILANMFYKQIIF